MAAILSKGDELVILLRSFLLLENYLLDPLNSLHIWLMSVQLSNVKTGMSSTVFWKLWKMEKYVIAIVIFSCDQAAPQMVFSVRLSVSPSVRPSVCLSHLFHHVPIIVSSWNFQELLPWSKVMSMQKVKVRGQRSRSQRSTPNLAVSGL